MFIFQNKFVMMIWHNFKHCCLIVKQFVATLFVTINVKQVVKVSGMGKICLKTWSPFSSLLIG